MITDPEKVAFAGDWHMNVQWACSVIDEMGREGVKAIVHTGDYGYTFDPEFVDFVEEALKEWGIFLYFADGNHDNHEFLASLPLEADGTKKVSEHVYYLPRGKKWTWYDKVWMAVGGAVSVDQDGRVPGKSWWPQEELTYGEVYGILEGEPEGSVDVMVTHDVPDRVPWPGSHHGRDRFPSGRLDQSEGHSRMLGQVVDWLAPSLLVHGHMHVRYAYTRANSKGSLNPTLVTGLAEDGSRGWENVMVVDKGQLDTLIGVMEKGMVPEGE